MKKSRKLLALIACVALLFSTAFAVLSFGASAEDTVPTCPTGNKNYADLIGGINLGTWWDSSYYEVSYRPLSWTVRVGADPMVFTGAVLPDNFVVEMDLTAPAEVALDAEYRILIGTKSNNRQILLGAGNKGYVYRGFLSGGIVNLDAMYMADTANVPSRVNGTAQRVIIRKQDAKLDVWVDGVQIFDDVEADVESGLGFCLNGMWVTEDHQGGITMDNVVLYNLDKDDPVPSRPEGNLNYALNIDGAVRKGPYWADDYYTLRLDPLKLDLFVGTDALYLSGSSAPSDFVVEADVTMPVGAVNVPDYRFTIGDANTYVRVMAYDVACHIYGESDGEYITGGATSIATRTPGKTQHYVFKKEGTKLTVWVDGNLMFKDVEIGDIPSGFGLHLNGSWVGGADHTIGVTMENVDIYGLYADPKAPIMPEGNKNFAEGINGINDLWGCTFGDHFVQNADGSISTKGQGCNLVFTGYEIDAAKDYIVQMEMDIPTAATDGDIRFTLAGASGQKHMGFLASASKIDVYQYNWNGGWEVHTGYRSTNYTRTVGGKQVFTAMLEKESDGTYITLWVDDKIILWSNGQRTVSRLKIDAFGSKFGFYTSGVSCVTDNSAPITMNAKAFYVASARAEVAAVIDAIPALTFDNYLAEKAGSVKAAQDAVNEYLANTSANTTADIANYAKFTEALEQIAFFESNAALFGALKDIEAKIAAIPVITEANYEAELAGSIKAAEDAVAAFVATYPDYDVTTAEGYKKLAVSKEVAENNGVAENLLYYANGVSYSPWPGQERGVIDRWTYSGTASGSASAVFAFPEEFVFDATRVYRYAVDVTIEADTSDVRIPFKGNGYLDYIYFRFGPTGVQLYDPVEYTERHTLGSSDAVVAEKGKTYHVEIITGYDFATVIVDGQVVISGADLTVTTHDYTAAFCGIQTVDSAASFANMHLSYYDGEVLTPDVESDNLIDHATSVLGNEGITGYYGTFEDATNTLTIAHQGLGGEFVGIELDRTKPYVFRTKATLSEGGDAVIMLDGDDVYTGLCVTLGNGGVQVYSSAFGEMDMFFASASTSFEAGKAYAVDVLVESDKLSVFVDGVCVIKDAAFDATYDYGVFAAFGLGADVLTLAEMDLHYATEEELAAYAAAKDDENKSDDEGNTDNGGNENDNNGNEGATDNGGNEDNGSNEKDESPDTGDVLPVLTVLTVLASAITLFALRKKTV